MIKKEISWRGKQGGSPRSEKHEQHFDKHVNARRHIVTKTCRLKREFLAQRKPSARSRNARKIICRTHFLNESLHTDPASLVSGLSVTSKHRDDGEAI